MRIVLLFTLLIFVCSFSFFLQGFNGNIENYGFVKPDTLLFKVSDLECKCNYSALYTRSRYVKSRLAILPLLEKDSLISEEVYYLGDTKLYEQFLRKFDSLKVSSQVKPPSNEIFLDSYHYQIIVNGQKKVELYEVDETISFFRELGKADPLLIRLIPAIKD